MNINLGWTQWLRRKIFVFPDYLAMTGASAAMTFLGYAGGGQIGKLAAACCIAAWR